MERYRNAFENTGDSQKSSEAMFARKVILVEGILIFENHALCDQMDIKIFVDTDADVRLIRRIRRDVAKRGRSRM